MSLVPLAACSARSVISFHRFGAGYLRKLHAGLRLSDVEAVVTKVDCARKFQAYGGQMRIELEVKLEAEPAPIAIVSSIDEPRCRNRSDDLSPCARKHVACTASSGREREWC